MNKDSKKTAKGSEEELDEMIQDALVNSKFVGYLIISVLVLIFLYLFFQVIGMAIGLVIFILGVIAELSA
jgi:predicted ABC-type exoprotein transport system permease subunit